MSPNAHRSLESTTHIKVVCIGPPFLPSERCSSGPDESVDGNIRPPNNGPKVVQAAGENIRLARDTSTTSFVFVCVEGEEGGPSEFAVAYAVPSQSIGDWHDFQTKLDIPRISGSSTHTYRAVYPLLPSKIGNAMIGSKTVKLRGNTAQAGRIRVHGGSARGPVQSSSAGALIPDPTGFSGAQTGPILRRAVHTPLFDPRPECKSSKVFSVVLRDPRHISLKASPEGEVAHTWFLGSACKVAFEAGGIQEERWDALGCVP
ncbi:hypothetical protein CYLTODRAFT_410772 [Cylindrobasidium torrendii FP15055 ss-10]|uniref:Uncharacterized protein n=1 Tax=Cylindrobasidium torrendii FP15055 ss-10 TaxID=1314674 RepID=A0A0D7BE63_9AGAR|nr:hypothetical protein CYLTODRAFT_410772 [Cylindrobasidium torrendii FP15055 ss-10]